MTLCFSTFDVWNTQENRRDSGTSEMERALGLETRNSEQGRQDFEDVDMHEVHVRGHCFLNL